jgi:hypothetical protein
MKFKKDRDDSTVRGLDITDKFGDTLVVRRYAEGGSRGLYVGVNDGEAVFLSRAKALKLAYAIISELDPID